MQGKGGIGYERVGRRVERRGGAELRGGMRW